MARITASGNLHESGEERLKRERQGVSAADRIKELRHSAPMEAEVVVAPTGDIESVRDELDELGVSYSMLAKESTLRKKLAEAKE